MAGVAGITQQIQQMGTGRPQSAVPCYKMEAVPRGHCVIINNKTFHRDPPSRNPALKTRHGTDVDRDKLESTFKSLHFTVETHNDLTDTAMVQVIKRMATSDHSNYDCFVCCILSHGNLGGVYGANSVSVKIRDLTRELRPQSCPSLTGKPKLFFMQACQGREEQRGYPELETDATSLGKEQKLIPSEADFLLAYSTVPGFVSYRNATQGSWFIGKLTELLNKHAHDHDIMDILTMVKHEVGKTTGRDGVMQAPATLTALRKKVYLSPHAGLRVLLLGNNWAGKSSLGNTLLGREAFRVSPGLLSITLQCQREEEIRGKENVLLEITDTAGLFDTHRSELDISREVLNGLTLTAPGPHVILLVLRIDRRFTREESKAYWSLKTLFGPGICNHMICIFNGMDIFEDYVDDGDSTIEECREMLKQELQRSSSALQQVLDDAGGRYMGMNNKASRDIRDRQAQDLIAKMLELVMKNGGRHFVNDEELATKLKRAVQKQQNDTCNVV